MIEILMSSWRILEAAALYLLFGFMIAGIIRAFISTDSVIKYLQRGRFRSGTVRLPLGHSYPSLLLWRRTRRRRFQETRSQQRSVPFFFHLYARNGGGLPCTDVHSLLGPILTVMRPITAFITALSAGVLENFTGESCSQTGGIFPDRTRVVDGCCDGIDCDPNVHARHHSLLERLRAGMKFAFIDLMSNLAIWFVIGMLLEGTIAVLIPDALVAAVLGSGIMSYLIAFVISGPMYVCSTLTTPVAAAFVMKGRSPGAALVGQFLNTAAHFVIDLSGVK